MGAVYSTFCSLLKLFRSHKNTKIKRRTDKLQKV